jgi:hypothetical protein
LVNAWHSLRHIKVTALELLWHSVFSERGYQRWQLSLVERAKRALRTLFFQLFHQLLNLRFFVL